MSEIYGNRWTSSYGENPDAGAAMTWSKGLAGISADQLADGLSACIASADPWPPTLPEFRARCLGVPSLAQIQRELRADGDRSGFAVLVWDCVDQYRWRAVSSDQSDRLIRDAYEVARERVMRGESIPAPMLALAAGKPAPIMKAKPEAAAAAWRAIEQELGMGSASDSADREDPATEKMAAAGPDA